MVGAVHASYWLKRRTRDSQIEALTASRVLGSLASIVASRIARELRPVD